MSTNSLRQVPHCHGADLTSREEAEAHLDAAVELPNGGANQQTRLALAQVSATLAQADATLAQADAIDRLTAAIEALDFPELAVKKSLGGLGWSVRAVTR